MSQRLRILHIEDNATDAEMVRALLESAGLTLDVLRVETREAVIAALEEDGFDLIFCDYSLPSFDGKAALALARQRCPDLPFIFVSGTIGEEAAIESLQAGATDYVLKSRLSRLAPVVRRALRDAEERTSRRKTEEALRDSMQRFQQLAESIQEVFWMTSPDMRQVLYVSPAYEKVWGRSLTALYQRPLDWIDAILPEDRPRVIETFGRLAQGEAMVSSEYRIRRPDGSIRWIHDRGFAIRDEAGQVYRTAGAALDITERKWAEARQTVQVAVSLILSESGTLAEAAPRLIQAICQTTGWELGGIWRVDRAANVLRCETLWHLPSLQAADFVAKSREITFPPGVGIPGRVWAGGAPAWIPDVAQDPNFFRAPFAARAGLHGAVGFPIMSRNEPIGVVEFFSHEIRQPDEGLLNMMADIGLKIGQFVERKSLEGQLFQAQKMEAIGQLAGGIAHDFNNLLTVINGYSEMMLAALKGDDPRRDNLEQIREAGARAAALTNQLLAFSRRQVLTPTVLDLNTVVTKTEQMLRRLIGEHIELTIKLADDLGRMKANPGQVEQIIMNLAVNARDAMPRGGRLTIETANVELDASFQQKHVAVQPGPYVMLSVSDTGCGMDADTQARIFEPFFTTKEEGKGTGLGLSTVYGITKQNGGSIWVYSEVGRGTTFKIYLPRVSDEAAVPEATQQKERPPLGTETILVVEDQHLVRTLVSTVLRTYGYTVLEAGHPDQVPAMVAQHGEPIHLLMTNVIMPGLSGPDLAERLKPLCPALKVLYMSGYTDDAIVRHGILTGQMAFLQKPFTPHALARKVREVLDHEAPH